jgi:hypothetical protein
MPDQPLLIVTIHKPHTAEEISFKLGCRSLREQALTIRAAAKIAVQIMITPETLKDQANLDAIADVLLDMADYGLGNITLEQALFALASHASPLPPADAL